MKYSKTISLGVIAIALVAAAGIFWWHSRAVLSPYGNEIRTISIGNAKFQAEVVLSKEKTELGLGNRESLCKTCAMLFVFSKSNLYSFWMKGMQFPLDIIWISSGTIVHIEKNVQPNFTGILTPQENADEVLELNAGTVDRLGLKTGDFVR